jgi:hypothetical protein
MSPERFVKGESERTLGFSLVPFEPGRNFDFAA